MCTCSRRQILKGVGAGLATGASWEQAVAALTEHQMILVAEAKRMRQEAIDRGDQPFGAVVSKAGVIIGYGPSRVVVERNPDAHAERVAIWDAQTRSGSKDLSSAILFSTSRPCSACENAAALANLDRMFFGDSAVDAGKPRRW